MRWRPTPIPALGTEKRVRRFLWSPLELAGEVRWLEFATIDYIFERRGGRRTVTQWWPVCFVDCPRR